MSDSSVNKYYFRVRRYLRNQGENELDKFNVQLENGTNTVTNWDYADHPQPSLQILTAISDEQVQEEINMTLKPSYTSDIYTVESRRHERVRITANRQNYCSMLTENEIHLNKIGFYRITASGEQSVRGHATTEFNIFLTRGEEQPTNISRKVFLTSSTFNFITFLKVDTLCKLSMQIELRPTNKRCEFSANFLVELL